MDGVPCRTDCCWLLVDNWLLVRIEGSQVVAGVRVRVSGSQPVAWLGLGVQKVAWLG